LKVSLCDSRYRIMIFDFFEEKDVRKN